MNDRVQCSTIYSQQVHVNRYSCTLIGFLSASGHSSIYNKARCSCTCEHGICKWTCVFLGEAAVFGTPSHYLHSVPIIELNHGLHGYGMSA